MDQTSAPQESLSRGSRKLALGAKGEELAVEFLRVQGMDIIERNFRCARGEIDIIARDHSSVVFVEVKTRRNHDLGSPLEAITRTKLLKIREVARIWLAAQPTFFAETRIDAVGIVMTDPPEYVHVKDAR